MTSLGESAARASFWNLATTLLRDIAQFVAMLVLARLLTPEAYGLYGFASTVIGFMFVFSARSLADYALQVRRDDPVAWEDYFSLGAVVELALFLVTNAVGVLLPLFGRFVEAAPLVHLLSFLFISNWPKEICVKMLQREMDWRKFRLVWLSAAVVSSALSVALALAGAGAYALALPAVLIPLAFWIELFAVRRWVPRWGWRRAAIAPALRFAATRTGSGFLSSGRGLVESTALTALLGFAAFGVFGRAVGLAQLGCGRFVELFVEAVYPALTKLEEGTDRFRSAATNVIRVSLWVSVPGALLLAALAPVLIPLVYGNQWHEVVPLMIWAAAMMAAAAVYRSLYLVLLASRRQRFCLLLDAFVLAGTLAAVSAMLGGGIVSNYLAALTACYSAAIAVAITAGVRWRLLDAPELAVALAVAAAGSGAGYLVADMVVQRASTGILDGVLVVLCFSGIFLALYLAVLRALAPLALAGVLRYLPAGARIVHWLRIGRSTVP